MSISETGFGVDVTARRADDLDRKLIAEVEQCARCRVLDLGCGAGGAAARLTALGAHIIGIDQHDFTESFTEAVGSQGKFIQGDIRHLSEILDEQLFDYVLLQRTLHYLPYDEAFVVLKNLQGYIEKKLFLSLSGLHSDLGKVYQVSQLPLSKRFGPLTDTGKETFGINAPLTLYTRDEAVQLTVDAGWKVEAVWQSAFGNIKMILIN